MSKYDHVFFFNDTATTEIYTLSLHDALPISLGGWAKQSAYLRGQILYRAAEMLEMRQAELATEVARSDGARREKRSEEHTSELQSRQYLVCRLLLEKKKQHFNILIIPIVCT